MFPLVSHGANLFNICPFPDSSALYVQNWFPIWPAVWPQFPSLLNCWSHKTTHNAALGYRGANCLSLCPFPDESTDVYQIWYQSVQPFDSFPRVWMCDPLTPPPPPPPRHATWGIEGWLVFSLCPFPDESADVNQSWCQSAQPFDSFPWLLNVWPPKPPPPNAPLCLLGQFVWRISIPRWICTCVPNLMPVGPAVWHLPLTFEFVTP